MIRTCIVALLIAGGTASLASAQVFTSYDSPAYSTYYHAPAYPAGYGPLGLVNWRRWAGMPYRGGGYTAGYAPSSYYPSTTSYYAPTTSYYAPTTSYYAPFADTTLAYYSARVSSNACCTPCCSSCSSCSSGSCPGGNCSLNYSPTDLSPRPDPASSGGRTIESESSGSNGPNSGARGTDGDNWNRPADGYNGATERGAGYPPQTKIEKKAPTNVGEASSSEVAPTDPPKAEAAQEAAPTPAGEADSEAEETFKAPGAGPAARLLDLDDKVTVVSPLSRERSPLRARFQSPSLARAEIDAKLLRGSLEVRLVRK